jgi:hypothetical protein
VIALRLPDLSDQLGRAVFAMVETPPWLDVDEPMLPRDPILLHIERPQALLMAEMPDAITEVSWNVWVDRMLASVIREPQMSAEDLEIRGPDREILSKFLLRLWTWVGEHDNDQCPEPEKGSRAPRCGHYSFMPNKALCNVVSAVAMRLKIPPHELLKWRFDELMLAFRMLQAASPEEHLEDMG